MDLQKHDGSYLLISFIAESFTLRDRVCDFLLHVISVNLLHADVLAQWSEEEGPYFYFHVEL